MFNKLILLKLYLCANDIITNHEEPDSIPSYCRNFLSKEDSYLIFTYCHSYHRDNIIMPQGHQKLVTLNYGKERLLTSTKKKRLNK